MIADLHVSDWHEFAYDVGVLSSFGRQDDNLKLTRERQDAASAKNRQF
jgi:hypothetical protein